MCGKRILHISDIHIGPSEASNFRGINARESLRRMLTDLETVPDVDVVVSGDVAHDGSVEAYTAARRTLRESAPPWPSAPAPKTSAGRPPRSFVPSRTTDHQRPAAPRRAPPTPRHPIAIRHLDRARPAQQLD
ncbi:metallophosphoesterase [Streptomyces sp. 900116325]